MQKRNWLRTVITLAVVRAMILSAYAQDAIHTSAGIGASHSHAYSAGHGFGGFQSRLDKAVGLTPEQRDVVRGLLAQQHQERVAMQEQTDSKIRALLSPEQQKKFDAFLAEQKQSRSPNTRRHGVS